jgi:hypothetical protein
MQEDGLCMNVKLELGALNNPPTWMNMSIDE